MIRGLNFALIFTAILALVGVYVLKNQSETIAARKVALEKSIAEQTADLSLLKADWAYLNQPGHIEPIIQRHNDVLNLQIAQQKQFKSIEELPMRPVQIKPDDAALNALFEAIASGNDPIAALIEAN